MLTLPLHGGRRGSIPRRSTKIILVILKISVDVDIEDPYGFLHRHKHRKEYKMTKKEQIAALMETIRTARNGDRKNAWKRIQEVKKASKVSFNKLGLTDEDLAQIPSLLVANKVRDVRATALTLLGEVASEGRSAKIKYLVEKMGITKYNAMYYVDRVAKAA